MTEFTAPFLSVGKNFTVELDGEWFRAKRAMEILASRSRPLVRDAAKGARDFLERYKWALIKGVITNGAYVGRSWTPVSESYGKWKARKFGIGPDKILQATTHYVNALLNMSITQKDYLLSMDMKRGDLSKKSWDKGITMGNYMKVHEYGYGKIPARPLWQPAFDKIGGYQGCSDAVMGAIRKRLNEI